MILWISNSGECLPIAYRMMQEGTDVSVYIHNPQYRENYAGIMEITPLKKLLARTRAADLVIFDITRINEKTRQDIAMLKTWKCGKSSRSVFGPVADKIRKYTPVIGGSTWTEQIEMDRSMGSTIAKKIGLAIPETHEFSTLKEGAAFLESKKDLWVFKPDDNLDLDLTYVESYPGELRDKMTYEYPERISNRVNFILQKKVEGTEISTEGWFNGDAWACFNHTIEDKRLMNFDLGPTIGSQGNTVWIRKDASGPLVRAIANLSPYLRKAGYIGPIDINCIIKKDKPYFLEFTPRMGYDAIFCLLSLLDGDITDFFENKFKAKWHDGYASSQRLSIPPYPYSDPDLLRGFARDVPVANTSRLFWMQDVYAAKGVTRCAGADGILGVVAARGNSIGGSVGNVYRAIDGLKIGSYLQYRTDGGKRAKRAIQDFERIGFGVE